MAYKDEATRKARQPIASKKWNDKNRAKRAEYSRQWRAEHPGYDRRFKDKAEYKAKHTQRQREYAKANPEKVNARNHNYRARQAAANGKFTLAEFKALCAAQGDRCAKCRKKAKLTADHITPLARGGSNLIVNIQGLCLPCNMKKHAKIEPGHQHNLWDKAA